MIHFAEATLHVYPDGSVLSVPPVTFESLCRLGNIRLKAIIQMIGNNSYFSRSSNVAVGYSNLHVDYWFVGSRWVNYILNGIFLNIHLITKIIVQVWNRSETL